MRERIIDEPISGKVSERVPQEFFDKIHCQKVKGGHLGHLIYFCSKHYSH